MPFFSNNKNDWFGDLSVEKKEELTAINHFKLNFNIL